ncbi:DUF6718 family protein [Clostridium thermobutyricum]|uniref:Uncharacterized protein n=1 Tax=Clostridium thermobutyricum DSM 4928 TaxID=1121339 RepID=A0A1V4SRY5_9CLOT|nr:DUF6718 family protein [Clostridium thermobutyricum]OPX46649.1 hypothetical protein CLTHE_26850 [Clostridium thermobutyricum DSM 4928]
METIILRKADRIGSFGYNGRLKNLEELDEKVLGTGIEIVIVNNIEDYKEYYPVEYLETEEEFIEKFNELYSKSEKLTVTEYILRKIEKYKNDLNNSKIYRRK